MDNQQIAKEVAGILLSIKAVTLELKKGYKWTSGIIAPIYCDNRMIISFPEARQKITQYFIKKIKENDLEFDVIAGTATAAVPFASFLAYELKKPMVYIRHKSKDYGAGKSIEGLLETGQRVLIIEDLVSTGGSSIRSVQICRDEATAKVVGCLAIFNYLFPEAKQAFKEADCPLYTLSNFNTLIEVAEEKNYLTSEEKTAALSWNADKTGWAKKVGLE